MRRQGDAILVIVGLCPAQVLFGGFIVLPLTQVGKTELHGELFGVLAATGGNCSKRHPFQVGLGIGGIGVGSILFGHLSGIGKPAVFYHRVIIGTDGRAGIIGARNHTAVTQLIEDR
ncbi:hypothetical protein SDC9_77518 [bioreactor metagenome]|uniref:Uncharacterized protein n=1 Tax=bioreactor metagenome TaxID=1076179 RepID=A0A644YQS9_9ZZZZ